MVSLLCELSALKVLEGLSLPPSAQIINAAGKFLIVGPNTADVRAALARTKAELDQWFLRASFGVASVGPRDVSVAAAESVIGMVESAAASGPASTVSAGKS